MACGKGERRLELADLRGQPLGELELLSLAASTIRLEGFYVAEVCLRRLVGLALGDEVIARVAGTDFDDVCFGTEAFDFFL